uniref:Gem (nuclear organelle) associated protein 5 n=1 Tax=Eptatretus burgeri TaxID=7764 RepID=A0A8C4X1H5_EPTBU
MSRCWFPASPNWYLSKAADVNDEGIFAFSAKKLIFLFDVTQQPPVDRGCIAGHMDRVTTVALGVGLKPVLASGGDEHRVCLWDTELRTLVGEHSLHQAAVTCVLIPSIPGNPLVISADDRGFIISWRLGQAGHGDVHSKHCPDVKPITCLSSCPHRPTIIAVGYRDGLVLVLDLQARAVVVARLRGHEDDLQSIAWKPYPGESFGGDIEVEPKACAGMGDGALLATGSRDRTVRLWSLSKEKCIATLKLPFLKRRGKPVNQEASSFQRERIWTSVYWCRNSPTTLISSSFGGELLQWDLSADGKFTSTILGGAAADGQQHTRVVFGLVGFQAEPARELLLSTSMDRDIRCWDLLKPACLWTLPSLGGFVYALTISPVDPGCLAVGVGDCTVRVWDTLAPQDALCVRSLWQGIRSKVTALAWHPNREGCLAFGTDDGKVGIYDVVSNRPPRISNTYHKRTVYALSWGPALHSDTTGDSQWIALYSCGGDGVVIMHNPQQLKSDGINLNNLIQDACDLKQKFAVRSEVSWKPDGKAVALGNEDGSIEVYQVPNLRLVCIIRQHHKLVNALRWHPPLPPGRSETPQSQLLSGMLASGSNNAVIHVHSLRDILSQEGKQDEAVVLVEPYCSLSGHTARITGLDWSPHQPGVLASCSYDGSAQVWDVCSRKSLYNYRGHVGRLMAIAWSHTDPDSVWTGGDDCSLHCWHPSQQEYTKPPKGKKSVEMERKKNVNSKGKGHLASLYDRSETKSPLPEGVEQNWREPCNGTEAGKASAPSSTTDGWRKRRKPRSNLHLTVLQEQRNVEDLREDCMVLAQMMYNQAGSSTMAQSASRDCIRHGLFVDHDLAQSMIQQEGAFLILNGHHDEQHQLAVWHGDLLKTIQAAADTNQMTDTLVSLAPMVGYRVWVHAVELYVQQLCAQDQPTKAATYLLALHRVHEAIGILRANRLYREAVAVARLRLLPSDPCVGELLTEWALSLEKGGHHPLAAKCYLSCRAPYDAAVAISRKGDVPALQAASRIASITGLGELAAAFALRCAHEMVKRNNWAGAQAALKPHDGLKDHALVFCTQELLHHYLSPMGVLGMSTFEDDTQWNPWVETVSNSDLLDVLIDVFNHHLGVEELNIEKKQKLCSQLAASSQASTGLMTRTQMACAAHGLASAALAQTLSLWEETCRILGDVLCELQEARDFAFAQAVAHLVVPSGKTTLLQLSTRTSSTALSTLEAFYYHGILYTLWWDLARSKNLSVTEVCTSTQHGVVENGPMENGEIKPNPGMEGYTNDALQKLLDEGCQALLVEERAELQALQRKQSLIQERIATVSASVNELSKSELVMSDSTKWKICKSRKIAGEVDCVSETALIPDDQNLEEQEQNTNECSKDHENGGHEFANLVSEELDHELNVPAAVTAENPSQGTGGDDCTEIGEERIEECSAGDCIAVHENAADGCDVLDDLSKLREELADVQPQLDRLLADLKGPFPLVAESCLLLLHIWLLMPSSQAPTQASKLLRLGDRFASEPPFRLAWSNLRSSSFLHSVHDDVFATRSSTE